MSNAEVIRDQAFALATSGADRPPARLKGVGSHMETLDRPAARTRPSVRLELAGFGIVAAGYVTMTLGILEIGGLFNVVFGLVLTWVGCLTLFWGEGRKERLDEAAFRRQLDAL